MESWSPVLAVGAVACAVLAVGVVAGVSLWMERWSRERIVSTLDALPAAARVVAFGCPPRLSDGRPNALLLARAATAAAAYHADPEHRRVVCSGRWDAVGVHEAEAIAEALERARVPADAIEIDRDAPRTVDTIESLACSGRRDPVILVTQRFHLPRALYLAERAGLEAFGLPAAGRRPTRRLRLRESLARTRAVVEARP